MSRSSHRLFLAAALLLFAATTVRADVINWTYSWQRNPVSVAADGLGTGGVSFTNQDTEPAANSSDIVATNLRVFSSAPAGNPDQLGINGAYSLTLTLTDTASGESGNLTFAGKLSGNFSLNSADISNVFTGPTTSSLTLGGNLYSVTIGPYAPPGPPTSSNAGSIGAFVQINGGGVNIQDVPEPSGLTLYAVGAGLLVFASWRRLRRWSI